jgi:multidrug efflux pump subunit AcrA (membrane-fusion protein)
MTERTSASWLVYVLGALCAGAIVAAFLVVGPASGSETAVTRTAKAAQGVVQSTVSGSGNLAAASQLNLGFKTSGTVTNIYVTQGQHVTEGQLLATLDPQSAEVTLEQSKAALQSAEANLAKEEETDGETSTGSGAGGSSGSGSSSSGGASASAAAVTPASSASDAGADTSANVSYTTTADVDATPAYTAPSAQPTTPGATTTVPSTTAPGTTTTTTATTTAPAAPAPGTSTPARTTPPTTTSTTPSTTPASKSPSKRTAATTAPTTTTTTSGKGSTSGGEGTKETKTGSATSSSTVSTATREANLASARAAVKSDRLTVQSDEQAVQDTKLYAPEDGTIVSLTGQVGEVVSPSGTTKASSGSSSSSGSGTTAAGGASALGGATGSSSASKSSTSSSSSSSSAFAILSDLSSMQLVVPLSESEIGNVKAGQPATVTVEALNGAKLAAHVSEVALLSTSSSGAVSYDVTFQLDQLESGLKVGMSATAEVVVKQAEGVNVPTSAITADSVTVQHDGKQERQRVTTGLAGNTSTIVLSGLKAGETVVLPAASTTSSSTGLTSKLGGRTGAGGLGGGGIGAGGGGGFAGAGGGAFFRGGG